MSFFPRFACVSIPFRAVTGFEHWLVMYDGKKLMFQSLSGLSLGLNAGRVVLVGVRSVSIPFRAVTGFERNIMYYTRNGRMFQSLSGLSLGLN